MQNFFDAFTSLLSLVHFNTFDKSWPAKDFKYQHLSTIAFVAVCDHSTNGLMKRMKTDNENVCGSACILLKEAFSGNYPEAFSGYSQTDHVQYVALASWETHMVRKDSSNNFIDANIFYSFRGSFAWDLVNKRRNSNAEMSYISLCDKCAGAKGHFKNFIALRYNILETLVKAENYLNKGPHQEYPKIMVIGMSMGGALATFAAIHMHQVSTKNVVGTYTFGAPRSGNAALRDYMSLIEENVNFAVYRDPVPHLPPRFYGYRHAARELFVLYVDPLYHAREKRGDEPTYSDYLYYIRFFSRDQEAKFSSLVNFFDVEDHQLYFMGVSHDGIAECGGFADNYMQNVKGTALFL